MSFQYDVVSEEEAQQAREFPLLPPGIYDFVVTEAKFKYSANGNEMIQLKLNIKHDGKDHGVFDNLISLKNMQWKTRHFCKSAGLMREYEAKEFEENMALHQHGTCEIGLVAARPKNDGSNGFWKAKNEVVDYVDRNSTTTDAAGFNIPAANIPAAPGADDQNMLNDDIPF